MMLTAIEPEKIWIKTSTKPKHPPIIFIASAIEQGINQTLSTQGASMKKESLTTSTIQMSRKTGMSIRKRNGSPVISRFGMNISQEITPTNIYPT